MGIIRQYNGRLKEIIEAESIHPSIGVTVLSQLNSNGYPVEEVAHRIDLTDADGLEERIINMARDGEIMFPEKAEVNPLIAQYNYIRGLKPKRNVALVNIKIDEERKADDPHFNCSEFNDEVYAAIDINGTKYELAFNKFSFAKGHSLIVPERQKLWKQHLPDFNVLHELWQIIDKLGPNFRIGYNSLGAHASVNHQHFHGYFTDGMPIEAYVKDAKQTHMPVHLEKYQQDYFVNAIWIPRNEQSTFFIEGALNTSKDIRYNILMMQDGLVLFPRKNHADNDYQKKLQNAPFTTGLAFYEMSGELICPNYETFYRLKKGEITKQVQNLYKATQIRAL